MLRNPKQLTVSMGRDALSCPSPSRALEYDCQPGLGENPARRARAWACKILDQLLDPVQVELGEIARCAGTTLPVGILRLWLADHQT